MTKLLFSAATIALLASNPAAAQLLGGGAGGALGGSLGSAVGGMGSAVGGMGGALGGMGGGSLDSTLGRSTTDTAIRSTRSTRIDKSVDRRNGKVSASGSHSGDTSLVNDSKTAGRTIGGNAAHAGAGSGTVDAQLVGTDAVRSTAQQAVATAHGTAQSALSAAQGAQAMAGSAVSNTAGSAGSATTPVASTGAGSVPSGGDMLALAGTSAASGSGSFGVTPGMIVSDAKGRTIGTVRDVSSDARGAVREVIMQVGDRTATLDATNFSGSGSVLVSAMDKGDVKDAAKHQASGQPAR